MLFLVAQKPQENSLDQNCWTNYFFLVFFPVSCFLKKLLLVVEVVIIVVV